MSIQAEQIILGANVGAGNGESKPVKGGKYAFMAEATWGGGSAKVQVQTPNGTWMDVPNTTLSANGFVSVELPPGQARVVVATSTAAYCYLVGMPQ